ncbi:MAG: hypothetical protein ABIX01_02790 [Chitinophagaceae bacterium]
MSIVNPKLFSKYAIEFQYQLEPLKSFQLPPIKKWSIDLSLFKMSKIQQSEIYKELLQLKKTLQPPK